MLAIYQPGEPMLFLGPNLVWLPLLTAFFCQLDFHNSSLHILHKVAGVVSSSFLSCKKCLLHTDSIEYRFFSPVWAQFGMKLHKYDPNIKKPQSDCQKSTHFLCLSVWHWARQLLRLFLSVFAKQWMVLYCSFLDQPRKTDTGLPCIATLQCCHQLEATC